jgi:hypothetical protein
LTRGTSAFTLDDGDDDLEADPILWAMRGGAPASARAPARPAEPGAGGPEEHKEASAGLWGLGSAEAGGAGVAGLLGAISSKVPVNELATGVNTAWAQATVG